MREGRIGTSTCKKRSDLPGRPATDQQMRMYMELRRHHPQRVAAAKTGFSERTGRRIEGDPRLPSQKAAERPLRRQVADPLGGLWESDILPLLATRPGVRPVTVLEEMQRSHPDRDWHRLRRTLERRVRTWCAEHGAEREVIFRQDHPPGQQGLSEFTDMADLGIRVAGELLAVFQTRCVDHNARTFDHLTAQYFGPFRVSMRGRMQRPPFTMSNRSTLWTMTLGISPPIALRMPVR